MDYLKLIKEAFLITWKNKFLWIFGLFAGGGFGWSWNGFNYQFEGKDTQQVLSFAQLNQIKSWFYQHETMIYILVGLITLLFFLFCLFLIISKGSIIGGVAEISQNKKMDFKSTFLIGWHHFWRVLALGILMVFIYLLVLGILALPVVVLVLTKLTVLAIILGILLGLAYFVFLFLSSLVFIYAYRFLIIEKTRIIESINLAYRFFLNHWKQILLIWLINFGLGIGWAIALLMGGLLVGGILVAIGVGLYFVSKIVLLVYAIIVGLALFISLLILVAGFNTFISSIWTLSYLELKEL